MPKQPACPPPLHAKKKQQRPNEEAERTDDNTALSQLKTEPQTETETESSASETEDVNIFTLEVKNIFPLEVKSVTLNVFNGGDHCNAYSFTTCRKNAIYEERRQTMTLGVVDQEWRRVMEGSEMRVIDNTALSQGCPCL